MLCTLLVAFYLRGIVELFDASLKINEMNREVL